MRKECKVAVKRSAPAKFAFIAVLASGPIMGCSAGKMSTVESHSAHSAKRHEISGRSFLIRSGLEKTLSKACLAVIYGKNRLLSMKEYVQRSSRALRADRNGQLSLIPAGKDRVMYVRALSSRAIGITGKDISALAKRYEPSSMNDELFALDVERSVAVLFTSIGDIRIKFRVNRFSELPLHLLMRIASESIVRYLYTVRLLNRIESEHLINAIYY